LRVPTFRARRAACYGVTKIVQSQLEGDEAVDPMSSLSGNQKGIDDHLEAWFENIDTDFRAGSLNQLILSLTPPGRVLDIGCGSGALSAALLEAGREVVSQDPSERMVSLCRSHLARRRLTGHVRTGGVEAIPERAHFDVVVALDVIEHIEDDIEAVRKMRAALKPSGTLVLSVPALSLLYGKKDVDVGHFRRYNREELIATITASGLDVVSCRYWNILGVVPVFLSNLRGKRLSENIRYDRAPTAKALNQALGLWFRYFEDPVRWPIGLTLVATARLPSNDPGTSSSSFSSNRITGSG
jgi:2-polyprenyl-3-methyl-5-hydroxy-6-metoxy-1,4-benzoquinol methylase